MRGVYEGPIYRKEKGYYSGEETLYFPDGQRMQVGRDMYDTNGGCLEWNSDLPVENVIGSIEGEVRTSAGGSIVQDFCDDQYSITISNSHEVSRSRLCGLGQTAVNVVLRSRSRTNQVRNVLEKTASPTVAARSEQIMDILDSR